MLARCTAELFGFAPVVGRKVVTGFDGGTITLDAGAPHIAPVAAGGSYTSSRLHLNLSVDNPASASTTAMIQNRITICGSVQPSCSKW
jgi:hypothetical protein